MGKETNGYAEKGRVKPLSQVSEGKEVRVVGCKAGKMLRTRLEGMGITAGQTLKVLNNRWGPVLVEAMGRKLAIGRGQAEKILVEELTSLSPERENGKTVPKGDSR